jgi:hypothetical protein
MMKFEIESKFNIGDVIGTRNQKGVVVDIKLISHTTHQPSYLVELENGTRKWWNESVIERKFDNHDVIIGFFDFYGKPAPLSKEAVRAINELFEDLAAEEA